MYNYAIIDCSNTQIYKKISKMLKKDAFFLRLCLFITEKY